MSCTLPPQRIFSHRPRCNHHNSLPLLQEIIQQQKESLPCSLRQSSSKQIKSPEPKLRPERLNPPNCPRSGSQCYQKSLPTHSLLHPRPGRSFCKDLKSIKAPGSQGTSPKCAERPLSPREVPLIPAGSGLCLPLRILPGGLRRCREMSLISPC